MSEPWTEAAPPVAEWIRDAERVVVLTGAGVSAESGVPTFRGAEGLWRKHDPMELATPEAFERDPRGVWAWYRWRQDLIRGCAPNAGHHALAKLQRSVPDFLLVTQNVDGLHVTAGSTDVVELHGNIYADRCTRCDTVTPAYDRAPSPDIREDDPSRDPPLPECPACGGLTRPGVVWFGESLPEGAMERATDAARRADVLLVAGTSGVVYPAAGLAAVTARAGGRVVVINPGETPHASLADVVLSGPSASVLPALLSDA